MTQTIVRGLLVGMRFRPPSAKILASLPTGFALHLHPDEYGTHSGTPHQDPQAVAVYVELHRDELESIEEDIVASGWSIEDVLAEGQWHIGFLARQENRELQGKIAAYGAAYGLTGAAMILEILQGQPDWSSDLEWGPQGEPLCKVTYGHAEGA